MVLGGREVSSVQGCPIGGFHCIKVHTVCLWQQILVFVLEKTLYSLILPTYSTRPSGSGRVRVWWRGRASVPERPDVCGV